MAGFRRYPAAGETGRLLRSIGQAKYGKASKAVVTSELFVATAASPAIDGAATITCTANAALTTGVRFSATPTLTLTAQASLPNLLGTATASLTLSASLFPGAFHALAGTASLTANALLRSGISVRTLGGPYFPSTTTTPSINVTVNPQVGDTVVVAVQFLGSSVAPTVTPPSGWVQCGRVVFDTRNSITLFYWFPTQLGSQVMTFSTADAIGAWSEHAAEVVYLRGVNATSTIEWSGSEGVAFANRSTTQRTPTSGPVAYAGDASIEVLTIGGFGYDTAPSPTPDSSTTWVGTANYFSYLWFDAFPVVGQTGGRVTGTTTAQVYGGITVVFHAHGGQLFAATPALAVGAGATFDNVEAIGTASATATLTTSAAPLTTAIRLNASVTATATTSAALISAVFATSPTLTLTAGGALSTGIRLNASVTGALTTSLYSTPPQDLTYIEQYPASEPFYPRYLYNAPGGSSWTTNLRISYRSAQQGDLLLLAIQTDATDIIPTDAWTLVAKQPIDGGFSTTRHSLYVFWLKDTRTGTPNGGEPYSDYQFTFTRIGGFEYNDVYQVAFDCQRWRNANFSSPIKTYDEPVEAVLKAYSTPNRNTDPAIESPSIGAQSQKDVLVSVLAFASSSDLGFGSATAGYTGYQPNTFVETEAQNFSSIVIGDPQDYVFKTGYRTLSSSGQTGVQGYGTSFPYTISGGPSNRGKSASISVLLRYQGLGLLMQGTATAAATVQATLGSVQAIAGNASLTLNAQLLTAPTAFFQATPTLTISAQGALTTQTLLTASANATVSTGADLTNSIRLAAATTASLTAQADLTAGTTFVASAAITAQALAALTTEQPIEGSAAVSAVAAAGLLTSIRLNSSASCTLTAEGRMAELAQFAASVQASITMLGALVSAENAQGVIPLTFVRTTGEQILHVRVAVGAARSRVEVGDGRWPSD